MARGADPAAWGLFAVVAVVAVFALPIEPKGADLYPQWLLRYDHGLVKRGLVGELLQRFAVPSGGAISSRSMLAVTNGVALATLVLFVAFSARVLRARRGRERHRRPGGRSTDELADLVAVAVLVATPVGAMYYVSNGTYLEVVNLLVLAAFVNLALFRPRAGILGAALVVGCVASTLAHENALLSTIPVMVVVAWWASGRPALDKGFTAGVAGLYGACAAVVVAIGERSRSVAEAAVTDAGHRYPMTRATHVETVRVLRRSIPDNVGYAFDKYRSLSGGGSRIVLSLVVVLPALAFLSWLLVRRVGGRGSLVLVGVGLLPFSLVLLGDDVYRWFALSVIGLAVLALVAGLDPPRFAARDDAPDPDDEAAGAPSSSLLTLGLLAVLVAASLPYPYFMANDGNPMGPTLVAVLSKLEHLVT